jgi:hypothetical protein
MDVIFRLNGSLRLSRKGTFPAEAQDPSRRWKAMKPIPRDTDYASVIHSDVPIVVQHTRLDSRQPANALLSTMAYAAQ